MSWVSFTTHRLPLLKLPDEILEALRQGKIVYTKATAIARVKDLSQRKALLVAACCENLSLTQIRERIKAALPVKEEPQSLKNKIKETSGRLQKPGFGTILKKQKQLEKLLAQMEHF